MASPRNDPVGKDREKDPRAGMIPLAELMKEAAEAQGGDQTKVDVPSTSKTGR